eukprot:TRINITY_DN20143_c0_g1_i1.p1 TRINITY_DN20143_c0_g1~~TRINITY_DN20143_c0_g1_i1.p1  ORF type:complete len:274 (+),score=51.12 TRINITY_DN20143_c0_g1_i1:87-824(+)
MNPPRETLYIKNIPDKPKKEDVKRDLYHLFSQFGPLVDVVAMKTPRTRGQAFVVYRELVNATAAMRELQGFEFLGKNMKIDFAKAKSDSIAKLDGTFRQVNEKQRQKERREKDIQFLKGSKTGLLTGSKSASSAITAKRPREESEISAQNPDKKQRQALDVGEVNSTLYLENFPQSLLKQKDALKVIFSPFVGFKDIRIPPPSGTSVANAFIEYDTEGHAAAALEGLKNFPITPEYTVCMRYAKK